MIQCFGTIKTLDENRVWLTQKTEESNCNKGKFTFSSHTQ